MTASHPEAWERSLDQADQARDQAAYDREVRRFGRYDHGFIDNDDH